MPPKAPPRRGASTSAASARRPEATTTTNNGTTASQSPAPGSGTRAPVQRLQTLKKRAPTGSIGSSNRPSPSAAPGGEPPKPTLKYKPRAVNRRSKEEREAMEKLEAQRHRERLAEAAAIQRGRGGGPNQRGGFGRGRGGGVGGAAGPLGAGFGGARRGRGGFGRFGGPGGDSRMSSRSRSVIDMGSRGGTAGATGEQGAWSSDESDGEVRISIDQINLESEDEGEVVEEKKKGKMAVKGYSVEAGEKGLRPIRVERQEHEERVVSVNMESSSSRSAELREEAKKKSQKEGDDALFVAGEESTTTAVTAAAGDARVKQEPKDDTDQVMTDVAAHDEAAGVDDGFLPKQKVKVRRKLSREPPSPPEPETETEEEVVKDPKSLLRTKEDVEEYERHEKDLEMIRELLSREEEEQKEKETPPEQLESTAEGAPDTTTGDEPDKEKEDEAEDELDKDKLSGQLFLMQFPPITPNLVLPPAEGEEAPQETTEASAEQPIAPEATPNGEPAVKREDDAEVLDGADEPAGPPQASQVVTATDWQLRAGRVGKLNVHASGRVTMNWGGISFELDRATAVDFLQEALIVSPPAAEGEEAPPEEDNRVWAMGQLSGKFTVTPDWEEML